VIPGTLVTLTGRVGTWTVLGQATYDDDQGREVEHDWLLVEPVHGHGPVEAVAPDEVTGVPVNAAGSAGVFVLGDGQIAG
jgi:hypothetical protein